MEKNAYVLAAEEIALVAGAFLKKHSDEGRLKIEEKGSDWDFVTDADKTSQRMIVEMLKERFPDHGFIGEEDGYSDEEIVRMLEARPDDFFWIADPLDGTLNYIHGLGGYCVSLGLVKGREAVAGVIYAPVENELFWAQKGGGAYLNGRRLRVSDCAHLHDALLVTGVNPWDQEIRARQTRLNEKTAMASMSLRMLGSAAREIAHVAAGGIDAFYEVGPHPWDLAAAEILAREAGATITAMDGSPYRLGGEGGMLAAAPGVHAELAQLIRTYY